MTVIFYLYFIGLMTSISLMDGFSSLLFFGLLYFGFRKKFKPFSLGLLKFFVPWILINIISLAANHPHVHWGDALADLKWMFLIPLVAWSAACIDLKSKFHLKNIRYFYIPILLVSIYAVLITVLGFDPMRPHRTDLHMISGEGGIRTPGFLGNPMTFAHAYGVLFCMLWAFCLYFFAELKAYVTKIDFYGISLTFLFSAAAIFLSFTRGAWISISIALLFITYLYKPKWGKLVVLSGIVVLILGFILVPTIRLRLLDATKVQDTQSERMNLWKANLMMFRDHPLTGVGYGENFYNLDKYFDKMGLPQSSFKSHAHNQFIQLLGGTGIFGLLIYIGFMFMLARSAFIFWKRQNSSKLQGDHLLQTNPVLQHDPLVQTIPLVQSDNVKQTQLSMQSNPLIQALALGSLAVIIHVFFGGVFEANFEDSETLHMFCFFIGLFLYFYSHLSDKRHC